MHLYRDYFKAKVCIIWVHGPLGVSIRPPSNYTLNLVGLACRPETKLALGTSVNPLAIIGKGCVVTPNQVQYKPKSWQPNSLNP